MAHARRHVSTVLQLQKRVAHWVERSQHYSSDCYIVVDGEAIWTSE